MSHGSWTIQRATIACNVGYVVEQGNSADTTSSIMIRGTLEAKANKITDLGMPQGSISVLYAYACTVPNIDFCTMTLIIACNFAKKTLATVDRRHLVRARTDICSLVFIWCRQLLSAGIDVVISVHFGLQVTATNSSGECNRAGSRTASRYLRQLSRNIHVAIGCTYRVALCCISSELRCLRRLTETKWGRHSLLA